jgi:hypothetical protein
MFWVLAGGGHAFFRLWRYQNRSCLDAWCITRRLRDDDWALSRQVVYSTTVGAFAMGIVPVDPNYRPSGEIFIDACLTARSGDTNRVLIVSSLCFLLACLARFHLS